MINSTEKRNVFIIGLHRSGTTLLSDMISKFRGVSFFHDTGFPQNEGQFLQTVYPIGSTHGGPGKFGFNNKAHMDEKSQLLTNENIVKLQKEWLMHWNKDNNIFLEKSPPNMLKTRFLQCVFPNSYFILIKRNPIAVSYATQKWSKTSISSLFKHWIVCHEIFFEDMKYLKNINVISYEDLVDNPQTTLNSVFNFIGIEGAVNEKLIDPPKNNINEEYIKLWEYEYLNSSFFKRVEFKFLNKKIKKYGYSIIPLKKTEDKEIDGLL